MGRVIFHVGFHDIHIPCYMREFAHWWFLTQLMCIRKKTFYPSIFYANTTQCSDKYQERDSVFQLRDCFALDMLVSHYLGLVIQWQELQQEMNHLVKHSPHPIHDLAEDLVNQCHTGKASATCLKQ